MNGHVHAYLSLDHRECVLRVFLPIPGMRPSLRRPPKLHQDVRTVKSLKLEQWRTGKLQDSWENEKLTFRSGPRKHTQVRARVHATGYLQKPSLSLRAYESNKNLYGLLVESSLPWIMIVSKRYARLLWKVTKASVNVKSPEIRSFSTFWSYREL